jgi:hypothetical protein
MARHDDRPAADHAHDHDREETAFGGFDEEFYSALILHARQPFLDWVRQVEPDSPEAQNGVVDPAVVLTPELPRSDHREMWLKQHHEVVFAQQLAPWSEDESQWPADRSLEALERWFDVSWVPMVDDLRDFAIRPDVTCDPVSLGAIKAEFASLSPGSGFFLDVQTGEMVSFSPEEMDAIEHEDPARGGLDEAQFAEVLRLYDSETLVELPSPSEQVTMLAADAFARGARVTAVRNRLLNALDAKKPLARFLEAVDASGLRRQWTAHLEHAVTELLRESLEYYGVPLVGETDPRAPRAPRPRS